MCIRDSVRGEGDAPGAAFKENRIQVFFQLPYGPADGRLADVKLFGRLGNISRASYGIEYVIE